MPRGVLHAIDARTMRQRRDQLTRIETRHGLLHAPEDDPASLVALELHGYVPDAQLQHDRAELERRKAADPWRISFRVVPYDWAAASKRAASKGRDDWARWISTGYAA